MHDPNHIVRRNLAYFWSMICALFLFYAAHFWGTNHPEIQTLLIGFVLGGGVASMILGTYFTTNTSRNTSPTSGPTIEKANDVTVNQNSQSDIP